MNGSAHDAARWGSTRSGLVATRSESGAASGLVLVAIAVIALLGTTWIPSSVTHPTVQPPDEVAATRHLLSRATYGVRADDLARALTIGREAWLEEQLDPTGLDDPGIEARLRPFPAAALSQDALYRSYPPPQLLRRELQRDEPPADDEDEDDAERFQAELRAEMRARGLQPPRRILFDLVGAKLQRAVYSERQLEEVMSDFWFNHFSVFFAKGADRWLVGEYEREAIRPHVFGRFEDMLQATAAHPAMLFYLDNWQNVAPESAPAGDRRGERLSQLSPEQRRRVLSRRGVEAAQIDRIEMALRRASDRGINENYARELLELHTLGVDAGYGQDDVVEVARVFTGWSIAREDGDERGGLRRLGGQQGPVESRFRPELHDRGDKHVLGTAIDGRRGASGVDEGSEVLVMLARHPATARHIATKLAVAFAADDAPPALVAELEETFLRTDGDLRAVTRALFSSPHFYDPDLYGSKVKSPFELVSSTLRVTDARVGPSRAIVEELQEMGELPYMSQDPTGYSDASEDWTSAGAVLQRLNFALAVSTNQMAGVRLSPSLAGGAAAPTTATELVEAVLPGTDGSSLAATIEQEVGELATESRLRALGLALGSPEFQRR